jgi:hypothetical protein
LKERPRAVPPVSGYSFFFPFFWQAAPLEAMVYLVRPVWFMSSRLRYTVRRQEIPEAGQKRKLKGLAAYIVPVQLFLFILKNSIILKGVICISYLFKDILSTSGTKDPPYSPK